jgi:ABC-type branched-subunit amino acid transport system ATPase component
MTTIAKSTRAREQPGASLSVQNVTRRFGGVVACENISLTLGPGELAGLIGSNGSGKTTLLNVISGFYPVDAGEIRFGDRRIDGIAINRITEMGISRTFQTPKLVNHLTVMENVVAAAYVADRCLAVSSVLRLPSGHRSDRAAIDRALECLHAVGLADRARQRAGEQDHGTQRLIEIARCMASEPRFVLLDEPAAGLSMRELETLRSVIGKIQADRRGVLLVEHNVPFVLDVATHVSVLHEGRCIAQGTPSDVRNNDSVRRSFLGGMV